MKSIAVFAFISLLVLHSASANPVDGRNFYEAYDNNHVGHINSEFNVVLFDEFLENKAQDAGTRVVEDVEEIPKTSREPDERPTKSLCIGSVTMMALCY
ncbi:unnamed protein product [Phyllotreta striolata]|uniref:Uncharacterized protein n=1 Tax=Phyllotreta striolata TaxID=444603 RepID=A0A9N9TT10_PHYSR|nr:unnamed protein product [Phyllotreta striolata]